MLIPLITSGIYLLTTTRNPMILMTTDAIYRETEDKLRKCRADACLAVEIAEEILRY